jgi:hypothetical protein
MCQTEDQMLDHGDHVCSPTCSPAHEIVDGVYLGSAVAARDEGL